MINFLQAYASAHPIFTFFIYIVACIGAGIGVFFGFSFLRKRIEISKNMKRRAANDKSR